MCSSSLPCDEQLVDVTARYDNQYFLAQVWDGGERGRELLKSRSEREAAKEFGDLFANEPERRDFAEYLTGLLVAAKKNVSGINAEFAETTDQSCLNRFVTQAPWEVRELNERRLEWHQRDPTASPRLAFHQARAWGFGVILDQFAIQHGGTQVCTYM